MYFDRFDIVAAHYAFYSENYCGQTDPFYARLCRISKYFQPSPLWNGFKSLSENGKEIYRQLQERNGQEVE